MKVPRSVQVLRIYIGASYHHGSTVPVFETLITRARMMKMAGATIFKCHKGYGPAEIAGSSDYRMSTEPPIIVEIVDTPENIATFVPVAKEILHNRGLMTLHEAQVIHQGAAPEL